MNRWINEYIKSHFPGIAEIAACDEQLHYRTCKIPAKLLVNKVGVRGMSKYRLFLSFFLLHFFFLLYIYSFSFTQCLCQRTETNTFAQDLGISCWKNEATLFRPPPLFFSSFLSFSLSFCLNWIKSAVSIMGN